MSDQPKQKFHAKDTVTVDAYHIPKGVRLTVVRHAIWERGGFTYRVTDGTTLWWAREREMTAWDSSTSST